MQLLDLIHAAHGVVQDGALQVWVWGSVWCTSCSAHSGVQDVALQVRMLGGARLQQVIQHTRLGDSLPKYVGCRCLQRKHSIQGGQYSVGGSAGSSLLRNAS